MVTESFFDATFHHWTADWKLPVAGWPDACQVQRDAAAVRGRDVDRALEGAVSLGVVVEVGQRLLRLNGFKN